MEIHGRRPDSRSVIWVTASDAETGQIRQLLREHTCDGITFFAEAMGADVDVSEGYIRSSLVFACFVDQEFQCEEVAGAIWHGITFGLPPTGFVAWLSQQFPEAEFDIRYKSVKEPEAKEVHLLYQNGNQISTEASANYDAVESRAVQFRQSHVSVGRNSIGQSSEVDS